MTPRHYVASTLFPSDPNQADTSTDTNALVDQLTTVVSAQMKGYIASIQTSFTEMLDKQRGQFEQTLPKQGPGDRGLLRSPKNYKVAILPTLPGPKGCHPARTPRIALGECGTVSRIRIIWSFSQWR